MKKEQSIKQIVERLRASPYVREKQFGNISSFNFTKKAFINSHWNDLTLRARGLFINTKTSEIVARGYDKFFNVDERPNTCVKFMKRHMKFPAFAYKKENGFLGLISYDAENDELLFASKSLIGGTYADNLRRIFLASDADINTVKSFIKKNNVTLVVEVIDPINDPHIIEYQKEHVVLLDIIKNSWRFEKYSYDALSDIADWLHIQHKELKWIFVSPDELERFISDCLAECDDEIEGYVIEGCDGFMVKVKTLYYRTWKKYRSMVQKMLSDGRCEDNDPFLKWVDYLISSGDRLENKSIIDLRNEYRRITNEYNS